MTKPAELTMVSVGPVTRHPNLWPPFTQIQAATPQRRIRTGKGALLFPDDGEAPLIDAISSWWVTLHGHGHPVLAEAIARQAIPCRDGAHRFGPDMVEEFCPGQLHCAKLFKSARSCPAHCQGRRCNQSVSKSYPIF